MNLLGDKQEIPIVAKVSCKLSDKQAAERLQARCHHMSQRR